VLTLKAGSTESPPLLFLKNYGTFLEIQAQFKKYSLKNEKNKTKTNKMETFSRSGAGEGFSIINRDRFDLSLAKHFGEYKNYELRAR